MPDDRTAEIVAMRRRDLALLHASELNWALFPAPERHDDLITDLEKTAIQTKVAMLVETHRREISAWEQANS